MFALVLAVVGLDGVVSYPVSCRFKELGILRALGAGRGRLVNAAVQPAVLVIVAGLFAGLASSMGPNPVPARWSIGSLNDPVGDRAKSNCSSPPIGCMAFFRVS
jgi:hypothetical protein